MIHKLKADEFLKKRTNTVLFDVRSPAEYERGHIPGAISLPLFSNEERQQVGTIYKQKGREIAIDKGLEFVTSKVMGMLHSVKSISTERRVLLYCWRGGMRSGSIAWMLDLYGFHVSVLQGGYKAYRHLQDHCYQQAKPFLVLGGNTGSGKTEVLRELQNRGEQFLDLEKIASHRGSAFGAIGMPDQPNSEHFTNLLFDDYINLNPNRIIWIEDESKSIGRVHLSPLFFDLLKNSPMIVLDIPREARAQMLERTYGFISSEAVRDVIEKVAKRMGGQNVSEALQALEENNRELVIDHLLRYYDRAYSHSMGKHERKIDIIKFESTSIDPICSALLTWTKNLQTL